MKFLFSILAAGLVTMSVFQYGFLVSALVFFASVIFYIKLFTWAEK